jgi:tetratricopeptide (TPR) repeat protein
MSCGGFRTKEQKVIAVILGLILVLLIWIIVASVSREVRYNEQAVMAENYLNAGSYEQAVKAYQEALEVKGSDQEALSIGLAKAYAGLKEYDKALEVLHTGYQKKSTQKLKETIEDINAAKKDYEFLQSISSADVYFANEEYDKAIAEYEEAKLIKSKDITSYQGIANSYIKMNKYDLAKEEVLEGIEVTKSEALKELLTTIDFYLYKEEYDALVVQAEEYLVQENYNEGIAKCKEAILLLPEEAAAYKTLAQIYVNQANYNAALLLLREGANKSENKELEEMLLSVAELKVSKEQKQIILADLFQALKESDIDDILSIMRRDEYQILIKADEPVFYEAGEGTPSKNIGLIINEDGSLYYGNIINGMKKGIGTYFMRTSNSYGMGYYYYEGEWNNNFPNGVGKTVDVQMNKKESNTLYEDMTVTSGTFYKGLEDGSMEKRFYRNGEETGSLSYLAKKGIPIPVDGSDSLTAKKAYSIGAIFKEEVRTDQDYMVEPHTIFGVKPYLSEKNK